MKEKRYLCTKKGEQEEMTRKKIPIKREQWELAHIAEREGFMQV